MAGLLDRFRTKIVASVYKDESPEPKSSEIDDRIALGVLLWVVAEADEKFLPEEEEKIKEILLNLGRISRDDIPLVLESIRQAAAERIDLYQFTREVSEGLRYETKVSIIENLFRVACSDKNLDHSEEEIIRKISGLFRVDHKEFIEAKIKIKKEFGIKTV